MARVYLDPLAVTVGPGGGGRRSVAPGAVAALARLVDEGHEVVLLGAPIGPLERALGDRVGHADELPSDVHDGWLITGDPERCDCHHVGYRMILVGRGIGQRILPTRHCDEEVRDLDQAVLHILLADLMPTAG